MQVVVAVTWDVYNTSESALTHITASIKDDAIDSTVLTDE